jgi:hypothetical protein
MGAQSLGSVLMAGGALTGSPEEDEVCRAFEAAVNEWCALPPATRAAQRNFNDYFSST